MKSSSSSLHKLENFENETDVKIDPFSELALRYTNSITPNVLERSQALNEEEPSEKINLSSAIDAFASAKLNSITDSFHALNRWEGHVISISDDEFVGVVNDLDNPNAPTEEVTVDLADVSLDDRELIQVGAVFYWNVGYRITEYRQEIRCSEFRFRRLPAWKSKDVAEAKAKASNLRSRLFGL